MGWERRFVVVGHEELAALQEVFEAIDGTYFRPHPLNSREARRIATGTGDDVHALLFEDGQPVAYGMLRGFDEGYSVPSLGIAVPTPDQGRGAGREMMGHLHAEAARRGATVVRLRVHPQNTRARRLYESLGYTYAGQDRGELVMLIDIGQAGPPAGERAAVRRLDAKILDCGAPEWEQVLATSHHDFYHLSSYVELCADQPGQRPCALHVSDGARTMLLPLVIRGIPGGGTDAVSPYGFPGPIGTGVADPSFLRVSLAAGFEELRGMGVISAFLRLHPLLNPVPPEGLGDVVSHGETVSIDLSLPEEQLWGQMRRNHRADIARADRLGYSARMDEAWEHFETFKRLYRQTMERRHAESFYQFSDSYFDRLRSGLGAEIHLCLVEGGGDIVAAGIFIECDGIVEAHLVGSDEASRNIQPTKLMFHFVGLWAKARGARALHLGGGVGGAADSLLHFKAGFSPLRHPYATMRVVIDEQEYDGLVRERDPELDPSDRAGFFPLYRLPRNDPPTV